MIDISGKVIHGKKYGRELGFPTANIDRRAYSRKQIKVRLGVWAGRAKLATGNDIQKTFTAAIVIGPIDSKGLPKLEAHLLGFKGNLYGKKITISLAKYLRPFKKYSSEKELKQQIKKDLILTKKFIS